MLCARSLLLMFMILFYSPLGFSKIQCIDDPGYDADTDEFGKPYQQRGIAHALAIKQARGIVRISQQDFVCTQEQNGGKISAPVVIFAGDLDAMTKRMHSLRHFLKLGYAFNIAIFLSEKDELYKYVKAACNQNQDLFSIESGGKRDVSFCVSDSLDEVLGFLVESVEHDFYLISDPEHALDHLKICKQYAAQCKRRCLGVFVRSMYDAAT